MANEKSHKHSNRGTQSVQKTFRRSKGVVEI